MNKMQIDGPSIKKSFIFIILIVFLITLTIYTISFVLLRDSLTNNLKESQKIMGILMLDLLEAFMRKNEYTFYSKYADIPIHKNLFSEKSIKNAYILSLDGKVKRIYKRAKGFYLYPNIDISNTGFFKKIKGIEGKFSLLSLTYSPFSNRLIRPFVIKRKDGYLIMDVSLRAISKHFSKIHEYKDSLIGIEKFGGIIISKTNSKEFPFVIIDNKTYQIKNTQKKFSIFSIYSPELKEKIHIITPYKSTYKILFFSISLITILFLSSLLSLILIFIWYIKYFISPVLRLSKVISKFNLRNPSTLALLPEFKYKELKILKKALFDASSHIVEKTNILQKTNIYLQKIIEYFPDGIIIVDSRDLKVENINQKITELCEKKREDIINKSLFEIFPPLKKYREDIINGKRFKVQKDKNIFEIKADFLNIEGINKIIIQIDNITEREKMEQKLHEIKKMETVNLLSKGFSHDFNNLLNTILGYTQLLETPLDEDTKKKYIEKLKSSIDEAEELVKKIQILSKAQRIKKETITIGEFLLPVIQVKKSNIEIKLNLNNLLKEKIQGDSYLLSIAITNIIDNAKEAVENIDHPIIKVYGGKVIKEGTEYIAITIEDNGIGIAKGIKDKIFDPFFTLKGLGERRGTGLGLTIVYGIISAHNGSIEVESEEEKGTKFTIYLPLYKEGSDSQSMI